MSKRSEWIAAFKAAEAKDRNMPAQQKNEKPEAATEPAASEAAIISAYCSKVLFPIDASKLSLKDDSFIMRDTELLKYIGNAREVHVSEGTVKISQEAFFNCTELQTVILPVSVTYIHDRAFINCPNLLEIQIAEGNSNYCSIDGCIYSADRKTLVYIPQAKTDVHLLDAVRYVNCKLPDSVHSELIWKGGPNQSVSVVGRMYHFSEYDDKVHGCSFWELIPESCYINGQLNKKLLLDHINLKYHLWGYHSNTTTPTSIY